MNGRVAAAIIILAAVTLVGLLGMYYLKNISLELCAMVDDMKESEDEGELLQLFEQFKKEYSRYSTAMTLFADNGNIYDIDLSVRKAEGLMKKGINEELISELANIAGAINDVYQRMRPNLKNIL